MEQNGNHYGVAFMAGFGLVRNDQVAEPDNDTGGPEGVYEVSWKESIAGCERCCNCITSEVSGQKRKFCLMADVSCLDVKSGNTETPVYLPIEAAYHWLRRNEMHLGDNPDNLQGKWCWPPCNFQKDIWDFMQVDEVDEDGTV